jgi:SAM-dependent methyltransferase
MNQINEDAYHQLVKEFELARSISGFKFYIKNLFDGLCFDGKNVLDIGAGSGLYSFYIAQNGAKKVVGLEPEMDGSKNNYIYKFNEFKKRLNLENVFLKPSPFQSYDEKDETFDMILLHHSVNHLNEDACINLKKSDKAKESYKEIFAKLYSISNKDADIIIADCANKNLFSFLGIKNIFAPSIEWYKHQSPSEWIKILEKVGFRGFRVKWVAPSQLGKIGDLILGNKICSFFIHSSFIIYAKK